MGFSEYPKGIQFLKPFSVINSLPHPLNTALIAMSSSPVELLYWVLLKIRDSVLARGVTQNPY